MKVFQVAARGVFSALEPSPLLPHPCKTAIPATHTCSSDGFSVAACCCVHLLLSAVGRSPGAENKDSATAMTSRERRSCTRTWNVGVLPASPRSTRSRAQMRFTNNEFVTRSTAKPIPSRPNISSLVGRTVRYLVDFCCRCGDDAISANLLGTATGCRWKAGVAGCSQGTTFLILYMPQHTCFSVYPLEHTLCGRAGARGRVSARSDLVVS